MKKSFYNVVKGKSLVSDDAFRNWRFIIFLSFLALIMIASSHSADKKVHRIAELNDEVKELKSELNLRNVNVKKSKKMDGNSSPLQRQATTKY